MTLRDRDRPQRCPGCGYRTDSVSHLSDDDAVPAAGDPAVCFNCGHLETFTGDGIVKRPATEAERVDFLEDRGVRDMVAMVRLRGLFRRG